MQLGVCNSIIQNSKICFEYLAILLRNNDGRHKKGKGRDGLYNQKKRKFWFVLCRRSDFIFDVISDKLHFKMKVESKSK